MACLKVRSDFETQLPAVSPNYDPLIKSVADGLVLYDTLYFLPEPKGDAFVFATSSEAAAIDVSKTATRSRRTDATSVQQSRRRR